MTPSALHGLRVLDLTRVLAGPWCSQIFADLGAEVIKIERPGKGDDTRRWGPPFIRDREGRETAEAAYFQCANRAKKSVTVDIGKAQGNTLIRELAAGMAAAVAETGHVSPEAIASWLEAKRGAASVTIGHQDLWARPV